MKTLEPKTSVLQFHRIIFDLDNTLIDAEAIKEALFKELGAFGILNEQAKKFYEATKQHSPKKVFQFNHFIRLIHEQFPATQKKLTVNQLETQLRRYAVRTVFPNAKTILTNCISKGISVHLLSSGDKDWQMKKIQWTGISDFFPTSHITIVSGSDAIQEKRRAIQKLLGEKSDGEQTLFVNDRPDETQVVVESFSKIVCFLRYEERDARFSKETFEALRSRFPKRVFIDTELRALRSFIF